MYMQSKYCKNTIIDQFSIFNPNFTFQSDTVALLYSDIQSKLIILLLNNIQDNLQGEALDIFHMLIKFK